MLISRVGGAPVMDVDRNKNVLIVKVMKGKSKSLSTARDAMMLVIFSPEYESYSDVQSGTLMHFHLRFGPSMVFCDYQNGQRPGVGHQID